MRAGVIVDTNVPVVANEKADQAGIDCIRACFQLLRQIQANGYIWLDSNGLILKEYRLNLSPSGEPGVGDAFYKWLSDNQANPEYCRQVGITLVTEEHRDFEEFPSDPALHGFDRSDQKFVAVRMVCGEKPPIMNASDTDWWNYRAALANYKIQVVFLCPELMKPHA